MNISVFKTLIKKLFPESVFMNKNSEYDKYEIGDWTYGRPKIRSWNEGAKLRIGKFCSIANDVTILLGGEHATNYITTYPMHLFFDTSILNPENPSKTKGDVTIGNDVWIGMKTLILSGVTIGNGAVIGAGSVVTKDVESYSITAGNPAKHIRFRFDPEIMVELQKASWWDWDEAEIRGMSRVMASERIQDFLYYFHNIHHE